MKNTRLAGHTLKDEGAPYVMLRNGDPFRANGVGTYGIGRALCSCGSMSNMLMSASERRQWHRGHKDSLR